MHSLEGSAGAEALWQQRPDRRGTAQAGVVGAECPRGWLAARARSAKAMAYTGC